MPAKGCHAALHPFAGHHGSRFQGRQQTAVSATLAEVLPAFRAHAMTSDWVRAAALLREARQARTRIDAFAHNAAIKVFRRAAQWCLSVAMVLSLADQGLPAGIVPHSMAMGSLEETGFWEEAAALLHAALLHGVQTDVAMTNSLMRVCGAGAGWAGSLALAHWMPLHGLDSDTISLNAACSRLAGGDPRGS